MKVGSLIFYNNKLCMIAQVNDSRVNIINLGTGFRVNSSNQSVDTFSNINHSQVVDMLESNNFKFVANSVAELVANHDHSLTYLKALYTLPGSTVTLSSGQFNIITRNSTGDDISFLIGEFGRYRITTTGFLIPAEELERVLL